MDKVFKGKDSLLVSPGSVVTIQSDGEFHVYGYAGSSLLALLGPVASHSRFCRFRVPHGVTRLEIKCKPQCQWQAAEAVYNGQEHPDPTPVEIPIGHEQPESLEDTMRRFIREQVAAHYSEKEGAGTFEDEDDFDIEDEDPELLTPYEMTEMEEEALVSDVEVSGTEEPPSSLAPGDEGDSSTKDPQGREQQENDPASSPDPAPTA